MDVYLSLNSKIYYFQNPIVCRPYKNPQHIYLQETAKKGDEYNDNFLIVIIL